MRSGVGAPRQQGSKKHEVTMRLSVKVIPRARSNEVAGWAGDRLRVRVAAAPEKGRANKELCRLIASAVGLPPRDVEVLKGTTSRDKLLLLRGLDPHLVTFGLL